MAGLAVLGASGGLGEKIVARALERGHRVSALVRDPSKLRRQAEQLTVFQFDPVSGDGLEVGLEHCQFVICAVADTVQSTVTHLVKALARRKKPAQRLVLISRVGASESRAQSAKVSGLHAYLPALQPAVYRDITQAEAVVRTARLPYCIFRATQLTDEPPGKAVIAVVATVPPPHRVSRTALAHFIVDSLEDPEWVGREVTVGAHEK